MKISLKLSLKEQRLIKFRIRCNVY